MCLTLLVVEPFLMSGIYRVHCPGRWNNFFIYNSDSLLGVEFFIFEFDIKESEDE